MKKSSLRKKGKQKISTIQNKIWNLCKIITRKRYGGSCYTCGAMGLIGSNQQTGHMWPKVSVGAYLKYDLRILRVQCYRCNINGGGQGAVFYSRMLKEIGPEAMQKLEADRQVTVQAMAHYVKLLAEYQKLI